MKRFILAAVIVVFAWLGLFSVPAAAQNTYPYMAPNYGPGYQTPLSPYLNLLLPGDPGVNYYGLVQPLFQARQSSNVTAQTIQSLMNQLPQPPGIFAEDFNAPMSATGHPTAINNTGSYFSTLTGQPFVSEGALAARQIGMGRGGAMGGYRGGMGGMGMGMGMGGRAGVWPNMRTGMGMFGR
jgi:hypothetical protein